MSFIQGVDFRATVGFATDPTNFAFQGPDPFHGDYPTIMSPSGINTGWEGATDARDRSALTGAQASLSGLNFTTGGSSPLSFRMDLPAAGSYLINAGFGDPVYSRGTFSAEFDDNTTLAAAAFTTTGTSAGGHFLDATGVERTSPSDWVANNAQVTVTLSNTAGPGGTTIFRCKITDGAGVAVISTLLVQSSGSSGRTISAANALGNFVDAAPFQNIDHISAANLLGSFTENASFVNIDHIIAADTLGILPSAAVLKNLSHLSASDPLNGFQSNAAFHNSAGPALTNMYPWARRRRR